MKIELNKKYENITTGVKVEVINVIANPKNTVVEYMRLYDFEIFFKPVNVFMQTYKSIK